MQINTDALVSLQIFLNEKHASIYSDAVKEGLSIYGRYCHFRQPFRLTRHQVFSIKHALLLEQGSSVNGYYDQALH